MKFTVYGSRGSIPCSGADVVRYGGETTCATVEGRDGSLVILDLGTGARLLGNELVAAAAPPTTLHVLLTHAHWDHLMGFPFFMPLYQRRYHLYFHGWCDAQRSVRSLFEEAMKPPFFPVDLQNVAAELEFNETPQQDFAIGSLDVRRFPLCHPNGGCGFSLAEDGRRLCFFPDDEFMFAHPGCRPYDELVDFCRGADILVHDAEYHRDEYERHTRGFGHTVLDDAVRLGLDAGVGHLLLWHHKPERTDAQVDAMVDAARRQVAEAGSSMTCSAAAGGMVLEP